MDIRNAEPDEIDHLARLWYDGWQDAHARIVPEALARTRTLESFRGRLRASLSHVRVAGPRGAPLGFSITKGDELYQLYVATAARGTGLARALVEDAERLLRERGHEVAWLACAIGNDRAARFYEKSGWRRAGEVTYEPDAAGAAGPLSVWRYERRL